MEPNGVRFLAAFNDIEELFRSKLGVGPHVDFAQLERDHGDKYRLPGQYRRDLGAFRELRNVTRLWRLSVLNSY